MRFREFIEGEEGIGTVELVLILVVLVALLFVFKKRIIDFVGKTFDKVETQSESLGD